MTTSRERLQDGNFYRNNLSDFFIFRKIIKTCLTNLASLSAVLHRLREIGAQPELMTMDPYIFHKSAQTPATVCLKAVMPSELLAY